MRGLGSLLLCIALPALAQSTAVSPQGYVSEAVQQAFADSTLTLDEREPPRFLLHYRGPVTAFRGELCYGFAGYNETCLRPSFKWLTPATSIALYAPANVPVELLYGYRLEVAAPRMFPQTMHFRVSAPER